MRRAILLVPILMLWADRAGAQLLAADPAAVQEDLSYITDAELKSEIVAREQDMARTKSRLADLNTRETSAARELDAARTGIREAETQASVRVRAYYRLSRNAGSLRFLLDASSPTEAIRRITTLRRLLIDALEARRAAGLRMVSAEKNLHQIQEEETSARRMLDLLTEAHQSRLREAAARKIKL